jgi:hypothetical protein
MNKINHRRKMKTAIIFNQFEEGISYHVINGDYSHLLNVYINGNAEQELINELNSLIFDEEGYSTKGKVSLDQFAEAISAGAKPIECGFYL